MRRQLDEIEHKAFHDRLTDLPNRSLFNDRAETAVREARESGSSLAVMLIDLDRFKDVNDSLGHDSGDRLLQRPRRRRSRRRCATTTPWRGSAATSSASSRSRSPTPRPCSPWRRRCGRCWREPRMIDGVELQVGASIGIALYPDHGTDAETLIRRADVAMYRSKQTQAPALYDKEHDHYSPGPAEPRRRAAPGDLQGRAAGQLPAPGRPGEPANCARSRRWSAGATPSAAC